MSATNDIALPANLRILLVGNDPEYFLMHRLGWATLLARQGVDLHAAVPFDSDDDRFTGHPFALHRLSLSRGSRNPVRELRVVLELAALIRKVRPHLVHHVTIKPVLYGSVVARVLRTPAVVNSVTGLGYIFSSPSAMAKALRALVLPALRFGGRPSSVTYLFENEADRQHYCSLGITALPRSGVVPSSGIDTSQFAPRVHGAGPVTVMLLSRMLWDKGVAEFVEAARMVRQHQPATRFVLVGGTDPNPESIPEPQLKAWHEEGVIEYWGWRSDVRATLAAADILCLPSYREGLPRSLLEGGAAGLALVTTDVPGCRDAILPGISGLLVPAKDPAALARAILDLVMDAERRAGMGAAAREHVTSRFSIPSVVAQTRAAYVETLRRARPT
jgi:glycosyltransferase involved in cell wall biosynthesis